MKDEFSNAYIKKGLVLLTLALLLILVVVKNPKPYLAGLFFGGIIDILLFKLIFLTLSSALDKNPKGAKKQVRNNYFARYLIKAVVLIVAALADYISFGATVMGLFLMKIVILGNNAIEYRQSKKGGQDEKRNNL